jgi:hypothetical protein
MRHETSLVFEGLILGQTGVDAVHESYPQMVYIMIKELQFVTCVTDD